MTSQTATPRPPLLVDLSGQLFESPGALWEALIEPCGLPTWFGRNLDAWHDALTEGISDVIDEHGNIVIRVSPGGIFGGDPAGAAFTEVTELSGRATVQIV